jgi:hypothetical protein
MFGPDDAFLATILKLLRQLPIYSIFGRGRTRLQPAYVEDVAEAVARVMQRAETPSMIFDFGGPRVYSYKEFLRAVAHQAGLAPRLIPIPLAVWHALAWASEMFPSPLLTRNQVELMQIDTVSSPEMPGFVELGISPPWSSQYSRRCCRIADERGSSVNPLQGMTGARATTACFQPPDVRNWIIRVTLTISCHFRLSSDSGGIADIVALRICANRRHSK